MTELNTIIVLRNDGSANWASSKVVLRKGEVGVSYLDNGNVVVKAGDGEHTWSQLRQIEGVFEQPVTLTQNFGYFTGVPNGGFKTFTETAGMTTSEFLMAALKKTIEPTVKEYPNVTFTASCGNTGASLEIGSYITSISYTGNLDKAGKYETNGNETASGLSNSNVTWSVTYDGSEKTSRTGSYETEIQIDSTSAKEYATITATATLDASNTAIPSNNLGQESSTVRITGFDENGTTQKDLSATVKVTGYRNSWSYVGSDCTSAVDSTFIRTYGTAKNANTTNFGTITIPGGTKRVMIAVPGTHSLTSVIDVDGMGLDVKGNFTTTTGVQVKGANDYTAADYTTFVFDNANGMSATKFTFTIA